MSATTSTPRIAMFLGAGASKAFGAPITSEILPTIKKRLQNGVLFGGPEGEENRQNLNQFLNDLMPGIDLVDQKHILVTEVLSQRHRAQLPRSIFPLALYTTLSHSLRARVSC